MEIKAPQAGLVAGNISPRFMGKLWFLLATVPRRDGFLTGTNTNPLFLYLLDM